MKSNKDLKIALVYDHLVTKYGGAEHVINALHEVFPSAPVYTSVYNNQNSTLATTSVRTSFLQFFPFFNKIHRLLLPLMPLAFETHSFDSFDIVISITSFAAKGVITKPHQLHICYLLTPTRYLFSHKQQYLNSDKILSSTFVKIVSRPLLSYLKWWDQTTSYRPDRIISISNMIAKRASYFYKRTSTAVIYPPVTLATQSSIASLRHAPYYLCLSRLISYKKIDICIESAKKTNSTLIIAGDGPELTTLTKLAGSTYIRKQNESVQTALEKATQNKQKIIFLKQVTESEKWSLLQSAELLLMPGEEDFGITALEAAGVGVPSVIHTNSGVAEILPESYSLHLRNESEIELTALLKSFSSSQFDKRSLQKIALLHSKKKFQTRFKKFVEKEWQKFSLSSIA